MAVKRESCFARILLVLALLFLGSAAAQNSNGKAENRPSSRNQSSPPANQSPNSPKSTTSDDFHRRVEARWKAAREGQLQLYVIPDSSDPGRYEVRVLVTRAPLGSDGMTTASPSRTARWESLLKLDDELRVTIAAETAGSLKIDPLGQGQTLIRHLEPGGHAEWRWKVVKMGSDGDKLAVEADVVYRRDFSPAGEPVVTYRSAETKIPLRASTLP